MPSLGQNLWFGFFGIPLEDRLRAVRAAGFDDVMIWWAPSERAKPSFPGRIRDGGPEGVYEAAVKAGLGIRTAHFPTWRAEALWLDDEQGEDYEREFAAALKACGERGIKNLVMHTTRKLVTPPPNMTGAERLRRLTDLAEKAGVDIAVENTRFPEYNRFLFERVPHPRVRFCYDCGHEHCFTPGQDVLGEFGSMMVTMHLHDNNGPEKGDEHAMPGEGNVDFAALAPRLKALAPESYNLESQVTRRDEEAGMGLEEYLDKSVTALRAIVSGKAPPRL